MSEASSENIHENVCLQKPECVDLDASMVPKGPSNATLEHPKNNKNHAWEHVGVNELLQEGAGASI